MIEPFRLSLGSFAAPAASDFLDGQKVTKEPLGGGRNRQDRQSQAYSLNRTSSNFYKPRARWPGGNLERHSDFARRKFCKIRQVRVPRNGGPRGRATWRQGRRSRFCRLRPPPGGSLVTFWPSRKSLAAGAAKSLRIQQTQSKICPLIRLACARHLPPQGEGLKEIPRKKAAKRPPFSTIRISVK